MPQPSVTEISLKITYLKFCSNLLGANELISTWDLCDILPYALPGYLTNTMAVLRSPMGASEIILKDTVKQHLTTVKHNKAWNVCMVFGIYFTRFRFQSIYRLPLGCSTTISPWYFSKNNKCWHHWKGNIILTKFPPLTVSEIVICSAQQCVI